MIKHYLKEYIAEIGITERITEVPSRDINEIAKSIKLFGPETYKIELFDINIERSYFKGKNLKRQSSPICLEVYKVGTFYSVEEAAKDFSTDPNTDKWRYHDGKEVVGWCVNSVAITPVYTEDEKQHIVSPNQLHYEDESE